MAHTELAGLLGRAELTPGIAFEHRRDGPLGFTIVGKVKNGRVSFAVCGQTNRFSQFKVDSICLPMFPHCGSFTIRLHRPLPHAKLSGTNLTISDCRVKFSEYSRFSVYEPRNLHFTCDKSGLVALLEVVLLVAIWP